MASSLSRWVDELLNRREDELYNRLRAKDIVFESNKNEKEIDHFDRKDEMRKSTLFSRISIASTRQANEETTDLKNLRYIKKLNDRYL